jgi:hypothetical protein
VRSVIKPNNACTCISSVSLCPKHEPPRAASRILKRLPITVQKLHRNTDERHGAGNICFARHFNLNPIYVLRTRTCKGRLHVNQRHTCLHITHSINIVIKTRKYSNNILCHIQRRAMENVLNVDIWSRVGTVWTEWVDSKQFYVLPTQCIYVFCVDLRTNSDYFPMQH